VNDAVFDIAIREMLNSYVPFESRKVTMANKATTDLGPTLEKVKSELWLFF
jgi:hypothetical protein